jgi:GT2 family glycosyltransferase
MSPENVSPNAAVLVISIVLVSYNTRKMTLESLAAAYAELGNITAEVFVVDNASTDGSVAAIRDRFPLVKIIENSTNLGFGAANNLAMQSAAGKYILLLNTDAFLKPGALRALIDYLDASPQVAVVGPRLLNADGTLQVSCYPFPTPFRAWTENLWISKLAASGSALGDYRKWAHDQERQVDWVVGACMLVRREAYEQVGGFDERFFMYAEEADWQRRMRDAGWQIAFTPAAQVTHLGGASGAAEKPRINRHFFESLDYYELKHHGLPGLLAVRLAMTIGCLGRAIGWAGVVLLMPRRRERAAAKVRLMSWLVLRQTTSWHLPQVTR